MSTGADMYSPVSENNAAQLKAAGINFVGRYYSQSAAKALTLTEAQILKKNGIYIVSVYEDAPVNDAYWSATRGVMDAYRGAGQGSVVGQPTGTVQYFSVDYDLQPNAYDALFTYASAYQLNIKNHGYLPGAYGSGAVLAQLLDRGLISHSWLAQSQGWSGFNEFAASGRANIVQHLPSTVRGISVDPDTAKAGGGWFTVK